MSGRPDGDPRNRLWPLERRVFIRTFRYRCFQFNRGDYQDEEANRQKALKLAYFALANLWVGLSAFVAVPTGILWSFRNGAPVIAIAVALTVLLAACLTLAFHRFRQAQRAYPEPVRATPWVGIFPPDVPAE